MGQFIKRCNKLNIYASNKIFSKYMKEKMKTKGNMNKAIVTVRHFVSLHSISTTYTEKIRRE